MESALKVEKRSGGESKANKCTLLNACIRCCFCSFLCLWATCLDARERHNCYLWWNGLQAEGAVWHEREQKRREKGRQRVIRGGGSVTGRSSLPRERPLQGDGGGNGYACHRAYWQSVSKATGRRERITGPGTEKCPWEKKNLLSSGFQAMRGRDIWSGWRWGGWQDHKGTGEWGRIYSSIVILRCAGWECSRVGIGIWI